MSDVSQAMVDLAQRLDRDEASAFELLVRTKQLNVVSGKPHYENDPEAANALTVLARSVTRAALRQLPQALQVALYDIGHGVSDGRFGPDFFKSIQG